MAPIKPLYTWNEPNTLIIDGVELVASTRNRFTSSADRFCLVKGRDLVEAHLGLLERTRPKAVVEVGVYQGGSVAMTALVADPAVLVALEKSPDRVAALDELIVDRGIGDRVHPIYDIDQADAEEVRTSVVEHTGTRPLDLVIDDASHLVGPTRATFETLFPLLAPGAHYVIEDWTWAHVGFNAHRPEETPLTRFVFELVLAIPSLPGLIEDIRIDRYWAEIVRGPLELGDDLDLQAAIRPRGQALLVDD